MRSPERIFIGLSILAFSYLLLRLSKHIVAKKKSILILREILIAFFIIAFSWLWFVPMEIGAKGESSVCRFRLQVFLCDWHDYGGYGDINDFLFRLEPKKYGRLVLYERIAGWQEYFGFKNIE